MVSNNMLLLRGVRAWCRTGGILVNWSCYDLDYVMSITGWQLKPQNSGGKMVAGGPGDVGLCGARF